MVYIVLYICIVLILYFLYSNIILLNFIFPLFGIFFSCSWKLLLLGILAPENWHHHQ